MKSIKNKRRLANLNSVINGCLIQAAFYLFEYENFETHNSSLLLSKIQLQNQNSKEEREQRRDNRCASFIKSVSKNRIRHSKIEISVDTV